MLYYYNELYDNDQIAIGTIHMEERSLLLVESGPEV